MSPAKKPAVSAPTSDVTPESAMDAINRELTTLGIFGGGQRRQALMVAGQRLHKALAELQSAEAHAKALRDGMAQLTKEAVDAVAGIVAPKAPKAQATGANGADASTPTTSTGGVQ